MLMPSSHASVRSVFTDLFGIQQIVEEYRSMLPWFEDWLQRRQLARVKKLLADRKQLPMAPYERAIAEAVRDNPAVVIAGDTGASKWSREVF